MRKFLDFIESTREDNIRRGYTGPSSMGAGSHHPPSGPGGFHPGPSSFHPPGGSFGCSCGSMNQACGCHHQQQHCLEIQTSFNGDKMYPSGKKLFDHFFKDYFHESGQKVHDSFHHHLYYESGQQAYDGFNHTVYFPNGQKAYDGFFNRAYHSNGKEMNGDGVVSDHMLHMSIQGKNGEFSLQLSPYFYARMHMQDGKFGNPNLYLNGTCVV